MMVIVERISAGLSIILINNYILNTNIFDKCMAEHEDEDSEVSPVVAGVSYSSCVHHVHI